MNEKWKKYYLMCFTLQKDFFRLNNCFFLLMKSYIRGREQKYKQTLVINIKRNAEDALNLKFKKLF